MSDESDPWGVSKEAFPDDGPREAQFEFLLRYAILAPSSHNSQPWRFTVDEGGVDLYADGDRWLSVADADRREWYISVGCALENLLVAAEEFGFDHEVVLFPGVTDAETSLGARSNTSDDLDPGDGDGDENGDEDEDGDGDVYVARVVLSPGGTRSPHRGGLFEALAGRSTNHGPYYGSVSSEARAELEGSVTDPDLWVRFVDEDETRAAIGDLVTRADRRQFENPAYRRELGEWIGNGALASSWLKAKVGQLAVTHLDLGDRQAATDSVLVESAPVVVVLGSEVDTRSARVRIGQTFERLALLATTEGLSVHPMSQVLELPDLRTELAETLGVGDGVVQHLFRLGYADPEGDRSSRRPLSAVVD